MPAEFGLIVLSDICLKENQSQAYKPPGSLIALKRVAIKTHGETVLQDFL